MKAFVFIVLATLFSLQNSMAAMGTAVVKDPSYSIKNVSAESAYLVVSGLVGEEKIMINVPFAEFIGEVPKEIICPKIVCKAYFKIEGRDLIASIYIDKDQNGKAEKMVPVTIGKFADDGVVFLDAFELTPTLVRKRYNWFGKLWGEEDSDYIELKIVKK